MQVYVDSYTLQKAPFGKNYFQQTNENWYQICLTERTFSKSLMISARSAPIIQRFLNMPLTSSLVIFC